MPTPRYIRPRRLTLTGAAEISLAVRTGDGPDQLVVLKELLPHALADEAFSKTFIAQSRAAAGVEHPNVGGILSIEHEQSVGRVVCEYLSGEGLDGMLGRAEHGLVVPIGIGCRIVADCARGVHAAHQHTPKLIHRDLRPSNVIVGYDGLARVIDFGIAKANIDNSFTRPGTLRARYRFAAPESLDQQLYDEQTDVFSMGVLLWELLTARHLFQGASPVEVLRAVASAEVPPPSRFNRAVPPSIDEVVLHALNRDRTQRTASAEDVAKELDSALADLRLNVGPPQVAAWMFAAFSDQHAERENVEWELMEEEEAPVAAFATEGARVEVSEAASGIARASGSTISRPLLIVVLVGLLLVCGAAMFHILFGGSG